MAQFPSHGQAANGGTTQANGVSFYPAPALPGEPMPAGLFRGYEVSAGHPACMAPPMPPTQPTPSMPQPEAEGGLARGLSERNPRAKRPAQAMDDHASIDPRDVPSDSKSDPPPQPPLPTDPSGGAKRPFLKFRPAVWSYPLIEKWEHPFELAPDDEAPAEAPPPPQLLTAQEARQLLDRLATADDALFLSNIQDALRHDLLRRRKHCVNGSLVTAPTHDQFTAASALVERWGGAALSDDRLDLIAHTLSWQAGLVLHEGQGDMENANFLKGVLSAVPAGSDTHKRWIRRILQEGFSAAHAGHPAYPLVGRGTLRLLLWALGYHKISKEALYFLLDAAWVPRTQLPKGDARRTWQGGDLQMAMAAVRNVLRNPRGQEIHPLLLEWLGQAGQFSSDELSFLAAGVFAQLPVGDHDPQASAADKARYQQRVNDRQRTIQAFLRHSTLKGARLAAAAFGLVCGLRAPRLLLEGPVLVDSVDEPSLAAVARGVARLAIATGDLQVAGRVVTSLMQWTHKRAWLPADNEDRQAWMRRKRDAVGAFLHIWATHHGSLELPALVRQLRLRVYESLPLPHPQARHVLSVILPPRKEDTPLAAWEAFWQYGSLLELLTAEKLPPEPGQ